MSSGSTALRLVGLSLVLYSVSGCGGELIRLGDGSAGSSGRDGVGGPAGLANAGASAGGILAAGGAGAENCPPTKTPGNQVVWIGDSWPIYPAGAPHYVFVRDQARQSGALDQADDYVNLATAAASMDAVANQYKTRESGATKVKVLIMDGGTWDTVAAQMMGTSVPDAAAGAELRFQQFLSDVASDGTVEHIVYFLVPPLPMIPGVDSMRPALKAACENHVGCHFIDLKDAWAAHPEYTGPSGIQPSTAGATEIGNLIWATMQANCIAQ